MKTALYQKKFTKTLYQRKSVRLIKNTIFNLFFTQSSIRCISRYSDTLIQGRRQRGVQWWPAPICNRCPPISCLASRLLHTSNTVFLKCGPPFWFLAPPGFWLPLLLNPGDGPALILSISV